MPKPPPADPGVYCPLWKKDVSKVCHACTWYIQLRGKNPNTGQEIDNWGCAMGFLPVLLIENAAMINRSGAAIESFRNEMVTANQQAIAAMRMRPNLGLEAKMGSSRKAIE
jgi:hypothetical protein